MADIKSMTLEQAKAYRQQLKDQGKSASTSKEYGKVENYIKTLTPNAEERYGKEDLGRSYEQLSRGVTEFGGYTEKNLDNIIKYTGKEPLLLTQNKQGDDLTSYLNDYQSGVYSAAGEPEIRNTIAQQLEPDMAKPEPLSRVDTFEQMRQEMGVADLETTLNDLKAQLEEQYAQKRARTQDAEGRPVSLGVIGGRVTEIERQENERIDAIGRQIGVITDQLNTAYNTISTYVQYAGLDYQDAVEAYNSEFNKNLQIYNLVDAEMDDREAAARANLQTFVNAITAGNITYSDLSADQRSVIHKLEAQSGLPIGFVSNIRMSPSDRILGTSSDNTQAWIIGDDGKMRVISTGLKASTSGGSGGDGETLSTRVYQMEEAIKYANQQAKGMNISYEGAKSGDVWVTPNQAKPLIQLWKDTTGRSEDDWWSRFGKYVIQQ